MSLHRKCMGPEKGIMIKGLFPRHLSIFCLLIALTWNEKTFLALLHVGCHMVGNALNLYIQIIRLVRRSPSICTKDTTERVSVIQVHEPSPLSTCAFLCITDSDGKLVCSVFSTPHTVDTNFIFLEGLSIVSEDFSPVL